MITIPEQYYVGFKSQHEGTTPLGFATPYEASKAFEKRKGTVDAWADCRGNRPAIPPQIIDNVLVEGFKIAEEVRRVYWGGGNVVWRMEDPRGWQFEITSSNLARILDCTTVINGVIQGKCVLGRDKAQNVLLPENSEPYVQATVNTARANKKLSIKDVKPGDTVILKDGREGIYLGNYHVAYASEKETDKRGYYNDQRKYSVDFLVTNKRHFLMETTTKELIKTQKMYGTPIGTNVYTASSDLHISEIKHVSKLQLDTSVTAKEITKWIQKNPPWNNLSDAYCVSDKPFKGSATIKLVPYHIEDLLSVIKKRGIGRTPFVIAKLDGVYGKGAHRLHHVSRSYSSFDKTAFDPHFSLSRVDEQSVIANTLIYEQDRRAVMVKKDNIRDTPLFKVVVEHNGVQYTPMLY